MEGSASSKAVPQVQCTSTQPASRNPCWWHLSGSAKLTMASALPADRAGQQRQGPSAQQQLGMQGTGAATSSTQGSERSPAANTQLQAKAARSVMTATTGRTAIGLLPIQPNLALQRPLHVQGSLSVQQGSVHERHSMRHSPVQQGPGWGQRAPALQDHRSNDPILPHHQPASSAEDAWGNFMTQQESMCAASDTEEEQHGVIFSID